ncbi:MAG: helix-turn-helix domain-containing protein [Bacteroidales bacterium]|nr:helix-turn-helix domain-containing protein [Bacteroidales bacterium]
MATTSITITKICLWCGKEFEAYKISTRFCSKRCAEHAYKQNKRQEQKRNIENEIQSSNKNKEISQIQEKVYLSISDAAKLLNVSPRAIYNLIYRGKLQAYRLSGQWSVIKKSDLVTMIEATPYERKPRVKPTDGDSTAEFYTTQEVKQKFGVSNTWVFTQAKKHNIPKVYKLGKTYWSKSHCDRVFGSKPEAPNDDDWVSYAVVRMKYDLTHDQIQKYVQRHGLQKKKVGKYTFLLRHEIDALLAPP